MHLDRPLKLAGFFPPSLFPFSPDTLSFIGDSLGGERGRVLICRPGFFIAAEPRSVSSFFFLDVKNFFWSLGRQRPSLLCDTQGGRQNVSFPPCWWDDVFPLSFPRKGFVWIRASKGGFFPFSGCFVPFQLLPRLNSPFFPRNKRSPPGGATFLPQGLGLAPLFRRGQQSSPFFLPGNPPEEGPKLFFLFPPVDFFLS